MNTNEAKIYVALLIAAGILAVFLVFFIITILRHQRRNQVLQREKTFAEIDTLEKERSRIAADLHDDLGPMLAAVKLLINEGEETTSTDTASLQKANGYIDEILLQLRTISNDLMPQTLLRKGLAVAVEDYVSEQNEKRTMQIGFRSDPAMHIAPAQGVHLYRIIHEVIHNAEKHAAATAMDIVLESRQDKVVLTLKDNGQGFDPKLTAVSSRGLGLKNILSRVETLNGELFLQSAPQKGTEYLIEIPSPVTA